MTCRGQGQTRQWFGRAGSVFAGCAAWYALLLLAGLLLGGFAAPSQTHAGVRRSVPFAPGERFSYDISWAFVHAGRATLEVLPDAEVNGEPARHFRAEARTSEFVDRFYKVRDVIDSYTDPAVERTLDYHQVQREGSYEKDTILRMDWPARRLELYGLQGHKGGLDLPGEVLDSLSILYHFRTHALFPGREVGGLVTDGKKIVPGKGVVVGREVVETPLGAFDCFRVEPDTRDVGGVFKKSPDARMEVWFTADERRIPVKVRSKVAVGHFTLELVDMRMAPASAPGVLARD
ncbi:MAG: DUF3108 domain-containing protein [Desulfovibrionaceae bacterium]